MILPLAIMGYPMTSSLRQARRERGLSLTALALTSEVPVSSLSRIERGQRCNQNTAACLAETLGLPPLALFPDFERLRTF